MKKIVFLAMLMAIAIMPSCTTQSEINFEKQMLVLEIEKDLKTLRNDRLEESIVLYRSYTDEIERSTAEDDCGQIIALQQSFINDVARLHEKYEGLMIDAIHVKQLR